MQALIILSLIVFYMLDQLVGEQIVDGVAWRLSAIPVVMLLGPALIGLQSIRSSRTKLILDGNYQRAQQITIGFWFISGLLIIAGLNWGSILRNQFKLSSWSPADELFLFAPMLLSLILCWVAQFNLERRSQLTCSLSRRTLLDLCRKYLAIRTSVFLVPALVPLAVVLGSQTLARWVAARTGLVAAEAWLNLGLLVLFLSFIPWVMAVCWKARRLPEGELRTALSQAIASQKVRFRDIRVWPTGNQMTNAMVVGLIPNMRLLVLTDRLLHLLSIDELATVVAHEAGHVQRRHLMIRIWFVLLPLFIFGVVHLFWSGTLSAYFESATIIGNPSMRVIWLIGPALYAIYAFSAVGWISRRMEFQADLFASQRIAPDGARFPCPTAAYNFCESLIKLAADSGENVTRKGWLHPSVASRVQFVRRTQLCPAIGRSFERTFIWQQRLLSLCVAAMAILFGLL